MVIIDRPYYGFASLALFENALRFRELAKDVFALSIRAPGRCRCASGLVALGLVVPGSGLGERSRQYREACAKMIKRRDESK